MRILMLTQFYSPFIGGEEQSVRNLSVELVTRGHAVTVVTLHGEGLAEYQLDDGVHVQRLSSTVGRAHWLYSDARRRHVPPLPDPELVRSLQHIVARKRPDIVHAHNWLVHSFLPLKARSRAKLVVSLHDGSLVCATKKLLYRGTPCTGPGPLKCLRCAADHYGPLKGTATVVAHWAMSLAERRAVDMFLPVSQAAAISNGLVGSGLPYRVIPNFVLDDIARARIDIEEYMTHLPKEDYLLFVGAFGAYKGVHTLLRAYEQLSNPPPLVLIGYDTTEDPLELNDCPPNVTFLKNWPHDAVIEAWRRSMLGVVPSSVTDMMPLVALEAMAMGRPVIASNIGGLPDIVEDGQTGFLVPPGNPRALSEAIQRLVGAPLLREEMGRQACDRARLFMASSVVPRFEALYYELAKVAV
jgi:glycosyltransferase involved in cell wall biosynthesis